MGSRRNVKIVTKGLHILNWKPEKQNAQDATLYNNISMLIRQTKDTIIRRFANIGYVTNQLTKHDLNFNETGADFLDQISRKPRDIDTIVNEILPLYKDISFKELKVDFAEFVADLENSGFVVIGITAEELNAKEPSFNYQMANPKTELYDFTNPDKKEVLTDSSEFFSEEFHKA